jgi:hypothetical protein
LLCCIQRNPTKGIESNITDKQKEFILKNILVAFKEIPQRELRELGKK